MRKVTAIGAALLAGACDPGAIGGDTALKGASSPTTGGWRIAPEGDLNAFFDCLDQEGAALVAAHRGGPTAGFPENALETFENLLAETPALIEVDVATSADGVLYLMHDDTLERTTTGEGATDAHDWSKIAALKLEDRRGDATPYSPPRFSDALAWAEGRTILEIDFKRTTRYEDVVAEVNSQQAEDRVIFIAYTLAQAERLHRLAPDVMISLSVSTQSDLNRTVAAGVPTERLLGFTGIDDPKPRLFSILGNQDIEVIFGTLGGRDSIDDQIAAANDDAFYASLAGMGVDIIATDRPGAAQAALIAADSAVKAGSCGVAKG